MADDEADPDLLELLRQSLGISSPAEEAVSRNTGVLTDAEYVYNNSIDVAIDMYGTKAAAASIYNAMKERAYSTQAWGDHELHPTQREGFSQMEIVNFVFTMDLLNFSFWSALHEMDRFQVEYQGRLWTGYNSLLACLRRGLDDQIPITTPRYWRSSLATDEKLRDVFRSATDEGMPLLDQRIAILREAADVLHESFGGDDGSPQGESIKDERSEPAAQTEPPSSTSKVDRASSVADNATSVPCTMNETIDSGAQDSEPLEASGHQHVNDTLKPVSIGPEEALPNAFVRASDTCVVRLIESADHSAGKLVNLLAKHFPCFRDETRFDGRRVRLLKRAQIFVADLWAAFNGTGYGAFDDIDHLTMFAGKLHSLVLINGSLPEACSHDPLHLQDYRVPQMLHTLGVLSYSPPLLYRLRDQREIPSGDGWEVQLRGCSIWAVELIRREIVRQHPEVDGEVSAVLIDFFLYDLAKETERGVGGGLVLPHHKTRSVWY